MSFTVRNELPRFGWRLYLTVAMAALMYDAVPDAKAEIIWAGDYETGDFLQWHKTGDVSENNFSGIPRYGRPTAKDGGGDNSLVYFGDGSLLRLVTDKVREGRYAAEFVVKNAENGSEPDDCDNPFPSCQRRRTELTVQQTLADVYDALPYMSERWLSISHYVPADWSSSGGGSFAPMLYQLKARNEQGLSNFFAISLDGDAWNIKHVWWPDQVLEQSMPWQYAMFYSGNESGSCYPRATGSAPLWADGVRHFPDKNVSCAALQSVNKGGWTDWVVHVKFDARGARTGGTGFLRVWKREDDGPWVQVLDILPGKVERGGIVFDHGIGLNKPPINGNNGGFGIKAGMYMDVERVWNIENNRTIINDNIKVGDENTRFAQMSPDGSTPDGDAPTIKSPPKPPELVKND